MIYRINYNRAKKNHYHNTLKHEKIATGHTTF